MNSSSSPSYLSDNEFAELVWDNGQIVTHDHSTRPKERVQHRHAADNINLFSITKPKTSVDVTTANDIILPAAAAAAAAAHHDDDDMVPWIHYSLDDPLPSTPLSSDPLHPDFCSDFFEGFAGVTPRTFDFSTTQATTAGTSAAPAPAPAPAPATCTGTELTKGKTGVTNFSLFKERLASGAKASTSTMNRSDHRNATDRAFIRANEKDCSKRHAPMLAASSSVCSVSDEAIESTEPKHAGKRKIREVEESSSNSEDMDDESAGEKIVAMGRGASAKKSRAAEVHNMSERRRRERINEKMKALQELIPNCSKADKASMLDDAIEYLKTLQLQVQMMSMGNGMYMPQPVMIPPLIQPLQAPPMVNYPPLSLGLYQMGMYPQLHGSAVLPMPQLHPPQFIPGPHAMHGMISQMPFHPQMPVPVSANTQWTQVGSSSENAGTTAAGASVGSTFVREDAGVDNPAKPDPKAEML